MFPKYNFSKEKYKGKKHKKNAYCGVCNEVVAWIMDEQFSL